jgi:hypothetical protein
MFFVVHPVKEACGVSVDVFNRGVGAFVSELFDDRPCVPIVRVRRRQHMQRGVAVSVLQIEIDGAMNFFIFIVEKRVVVAAPSFAQMVEGPATAGVSVVVRREQLVVIFEKIFEVVVSEHASQILFFVALLAMRAVRLYGVLRVVTARHCLRLVCASREQRRRGDQKQWYEEVFHSILHIRQVYQRRGSKANMPTTAARAACPA